MNLLRPSLTLLRTGALPLLLQLSACAGPAYYAQAISGHLSLMRQREEIADILSAAEADQETLRELELAVEIRNFATQRLGLPDNGSFTRFVSTGREALTWNVVATPELSLEPRRWCFLVAGCVPYRGYFQPDAATRFADRLRADGYDVDIAPAQAYSTLGWFEDPLIDTMLRYREEELAGVIFHELAHQKLYLRGDTAFSESYATFVEETGVMLWLQASGRADRLPDWLRRRQAAVQFDGLLLQARASLSELYALTASDTAKRESKAAIFSQLARDYRVLVADSWGEVDFFAGWFSDELNNARLALFASYRAGLCAFTNLFHADGERIERFHAHAAELARMGSAARRAWLDQPCTPVASGDDL